MKNKKLILICDDDDGIIDVTTIVLEELGYTVESCTNSELFFLMVEKQQPSLIFLDLWMPGMGGDEITKTLKKSVSTKNIPVIIMSANKDTQTIAQLAGADNFLCKPFDIAELENMAKQYT